jgi:tape measure domain-containing protein
MSKTVDERIVSMQFDNKRFESNVATTMSSIDKLKDKLNFKGAVKGLETIDAASKKVNMSYMIGAVDNVGLKFNAMFSIADQALRNITNSAMNAGKQIISALTIDPVKTGFQEYETQINAVQTILANTKSKGTTLDDVNMALDELNTYADKTIYNFTEMTRNIGTFTAAGVDLNTATNAIQGIANLAAVSGSTSQQASTAMYQLSQALSSGTVKLMDWNSVVNAGMGGQVFQDALKETARVHGIAIDKMIDKNGSFRETLQEGWLTSEILTETLQKFTMTTEGLTEAQIEQNRQMLKSKGYTDDQIKSIFELGETATDAATKVKTFTQLTDTLKEAAQSGWTQTWELIVGDFEQSKGLWTKVSDVIGDMINNSSKARNTMLEGALTSNWDKLIKKVNEAGVETTAFEAKLSEVATNHGIDVTALITEHGSLQQAFKSGAVSTDIMKEAVKGLNTSLIDLKSIGKTLRRGDTGDDVKKIQEALESLNFSVGKYGIDGSLGPDTQKAIKAFQEANGLKVTGMVDEETLSKLQELTGKVVDLSGSVDSLIDGITELGGRELLIESLKNVFEAVMAVVKPIKEAFREIFPPTTSEQVYRLIEGFNNFTKKLMISKDTSDKLKSTFKGLFAILDIVKQAFSAVFKAIVPLFGGMSTLGGGILDVTASWGDWLVNLNETLKTTNFFANATNKLKQVLATAYEGIKAFLEPVIEKIKELAPAFVSIYQTAKTFFEPITEMFKNMGSTFVSTLSTVSDKAERLLAPFKAIGTAILVLFKGIGSLISLIMPLVVNFVSMVGNTFSDLIGGIVSSIQEGDYNRLFDILNGGILAAIGAGIARFTNNLGGIAKKAKDIVESISEIFEGVGEVFNAFATSIKVKALKDIASAIAVLAVSLFIISIIDSEKLTGAIGAITVMFIELIQAMSSFGQIAEGKSLKGIYAVSTGLKALTTALLIMAIALKIMGSMSWKEMGVGLISMTACLGELVAAVNLLPEKEVKGAAKAIKKIASAVVVLAIALKIMGSMSWKEMGVGLISMATALGTLVGVVWALPKDADVKAGQIVAFSLAVVVLSIALKAMGSMSWKEMGVGLISMAASLGILVGVLWALPKDVSSKAGAILGLSVVMVILASALKIMGSMSWKEMGVGLISMAVSLGVLVGVLWALPKDAGGKAGAILVISAALVVLSLALKTMGSMSWGEIIKGLVTLAGAFVIIGVAGYLIGPLAPAILALGGAVALLGAGVLAAGVGIVAFAAGIAILGAALATSGGAITIFITGIISLIPFLIEQIGVGIVKACKVISGSASEICKAVISIVTSIIEALKTTIPMITEGFFQLIINILQTLTTYIPQIVPLLVNLFKSLVDVIVEYLPTIMESITKLLVAIIEGITANITTLIEPLVTMFVTIFQSIADAIGPIINEVIAPILTILKDLLTGLFEAIAPYIPDICALFTELTNIITNAIVKIVEAIAPYIPEITEAVKTICSAFTSLVQQLSPIILSITILVAQLGNSISQILNSIVGVVKALGAAIAEILQGIADVVASIGTAISDILQGIADVVSSIGETIEGALQGIADIIGEIGGVIEESLNGLSGIFDSVFNGISEVISTVGDSIKTVLDGISGVIESVGTAALNAGTGFEKLASGIKTITKLNVADVAASLAAVAVGVGEISNHGSGLKKAGEGMKNIADNVTTASSKFKDMESRISTMSKLLTDLAPTASKSMLTLTSSIQTIIPALLAANSQIRDQMSSVESTITSAVKACVKSVKGLRSRFEDVGEYLISGLAAGIRANKPAATKAAREVANAVETIIRAAWQVNSPSKVFYRIALGVGEGMENAFGDSTNGVKSSALDLANTATNGISKAIQSISDIISLDIDSQPTITPVLDMSNITSGANAINGLFSGRRTLAIDTGMVGSVAASMANRQNGMDTSDVVSSIKALRKDLANMPRESININGITYDDGSNIADAVQTLVRAAKIERRV